MRLFLRDHLSFVVLYLLTSFGLVLTMNFLGGLEDGLVYYIFLSLFFLLIFLLIRYFRNDRLYTSLSEKPRDLNDALLNEPRSALERDYARRQRELYELYNQRILELESAQRDYKFLIDQSVHQMKTPLAVISMLAQDHSSEEDFEKVLLQVRNLDYHLSQTLKFLRLTDIERDLYIEKVNLRSMVVELVNELKDFFILNSIFPAVDIGSDVYVFTDQKQMKTVLYQIINNGIKYGRKGSRLKIYLEEDSSNFILKIGNEGIGIEPSSINRIFDLFYTGESGRLYGESSGVGLYIVKKTLDFLSHPIELESNPGGETVFSIYFLKS